MKGVFLMELEEDDGAATLADDLGISLHALTGIAGANTMQLLVTIAGQELHALVDSGSTHTFIHDVVVHRLGLKVTLQPGLSVMVANGEQL
jgi:predicted aspartyl protease